MKMDCNLLAESAGRLTLFNAPGFYLARAPRDEKVVIIEIAT